MGCGFLEEFGSLLCPAFGREIMDSSLVFDWNKSNPYRLNRPVTGQVQCQIAPSIQTKEDPVGRLNWMMPLNGTVQSK